MKILGILFKQNQFLNILTIFVTIIFFTLVFVLVINLDQTNIETKTANNFENQNVFQITDQLINEREEEFFSENNGYDVLNSFTNTLSESSEFTFYTAVWQPIGIANFKGDRLFDPNYQNGSSTPSYQINNKTYSSVLSLQANDAVFKLNNLKIYKGRYFSKDEYIFKENTATIPVILGNRYFKLYQIGETINIFLYGKELTGKVIGFLDSSEKVMTTNQPELNLDKYIILPSIIFNNAPSEYLLKDKNNELFFRASLLARTNNLILTKNTPLNTRKIIDHISMNTGFYDFQVIGANSLAINALVSMTKANVTFIYIAISLLFLITMFTILYALFLKVKKNVDTYTVFLISGANMQHIKKYVRNEFVLMTLISVAIPILPFLIITSSLKTLLIYLFVSFVSVLTITLLTGLFTNKVFTKINIIQHLKR